MFNIAIIGPPSVGKTCWCKKILYGIYENNYTKTYEPTPYLITHHNNKFNCIDIPSYKTETYINQNNNIDGIFIMCEMSDEHLSMVKKWKSLLKQNVKLILIINKLDLDREETVDLELFCNINNIDICTGITIKDDFNIMEPFDKMCQLLNGHIQQIDSQFIIQIIDMLSKSKNMEEFKIKYLEFIYKNDDIKIKKLILTLNEMIIKHENLHYFLNYLVDLYKYT
jgi:GTPase SAR1 family protein